MSMKTADTIAANPRTLDWPIWDVARMTGTTSRTLRHYGDIGLLRPSRVGSSGTRYYDGTALARLQRILLLRQLGLGLPAIGEVLAGTESHDAALETHLALLRSELHRLHRQIGAVETTILRIKRGEQLMAEDMFDGFDHTVHKDEVTERWGADAYATGDRWWRSMSTGEKAAWRARQQALSAAWVDAASRGVSPDSDEAQRLATRHVEWLAAVPGTPRDHAGAPSEGYLIGLVGMYVDDERFAAHYGGRRGAEFVRDAVTAWVERNRRGVDAPVR